MAKQSISKRRIRSAKTTRDRVVIPIEVEHALSYHLGKWSTHGLVGELSTTRWIAICKRLMRNLEKYIAINVESDRTHLDRLRFRIDQMKEALKVRPGYKREPKLVMELLNTCLLLIGKEPDQWMRRVVNRPAYFKLSAFRSCHYSQTIQQKVNVIFWAKANSLIPELTKEDHEQLRFKAWRMPPKTFLDWFRTTYPHAYLRLF